MKKPLSHVVLSEAQLALAKLSPQDSFSPGLEHLRITREFVDVTNGKYLVRVPHAQERGDDQLKPGGKPLVDNLYLPRNVALRMLSAVKGAAGRMMLCTSTDKSRTWKELIPRRFVAFFMGEKPALYTDHDEGDVTLTASLEKGLLFPSFDPVLALAKETPYAVTLNVEILIALAKWAERYSELGPVGLHFFISQKPGDPVKVEIPLSEGITATAILMPMTSLHHEDLPPERKSRYMPTKSTPVPPSADQVAQEAEKA